MTSLMQKWQDAVEAKGSVLCVGIDPAEPGQRPSRTVPADMDKLDYCLRVIEEVAPFAAAIKPNRQYLRDLSRAQMQDLTTRIHELGMVAIDDSKIADIGDTNESAFYHSKIEGYDAITYAPFPGNIASAAEAARKHDIGLITLVLMSNPEFKVMKEAQFGEDTGSLFFAKAVREAKGEGIVLGAPSAQNHITSEDIEGIRSSLDQQLILVPGIGAQGGEISSLLEAFGSRVIANVGRAIFYAENPGEAAERYSKMLRL